MFKLSQKVVDYLTIVNHLSPSSQKTGFYVIKRFFVNGLQSDTYDPSLLLDINHVKQSLTIFPISTIDNMICYLTKITQEDFINIFSSVTRHYVNYKSITNDVNSFDTLLFDKLYEPLSKAVDLIKVDNYHNNDKIIYVRLLCFTIETYLLLNHIYVNGIHLKKNPIVSTIYNNMITCSQNINDSDQNL